VVDMDGFFGGDRAIGGDGKVNFSREVRVVVSEQYLNTPPCIVVLCDLNLQNSIVSWNTSNAAAHKH
jgi:hypothetical protein